MRTPVLFLAHGAPPLLDDAVWMAQLAGVANQIARPKAILMVSAHWEAAPPTIGATTPVPLVYDFYGFPDKYYRQLYPAPGAPALAARLKQLIPSLQQDPKRGLDHGAYVPLVAMCPKADIPVLQLSLPTLDPAALLAVGRRLAPLSEEGVLIVGSGFLTHNLRYIGAGVPSWASEFDAWVADTLVRRDLDGLVNFMGLAPGAQIAHPRTEHFVPLLVAQGAAGDAIPQFPITGWWWGPFTKRSVCW